jgi:lactonase family protein with 7-bladed beta-propeller
LRRLRSSEWAVCLRHDPLDGDEERERTVFAGGENSIGVFSINNSTGESTRLQHIDTRGMSPRTFAVDPAGRVLIAANQTPLIVAKGGGVKVLPAGFRYFESTKTEG